AHARLEERLGTRLRVVDLFSHPTVAALAKHCRPGEGEPDGAAATADPRVDQIKAGQARLLKKRQLQRLGSPL
ncbi:MAG TPA: acyl carrier protein, partial [Thermoanaerobaculia bacterium]